MSPHRNSAISAGRAILFLTYLTLMGWDIGSGGAVDDLAALQKIAHVCAWWTLAAGAVVILVRVRALPASLVLAHAAPRCLQVALHGLFGLSYLLAGLIAGALATIAIVATYVMGSRARIGELPG